MIERGGRGGGFRGGIWGGGGIPGGGVFGEEGGIREGGRAFWEEGRRVLAPMPICDYC